MTGKFQIGKGQYWFRDDPRRPISEDIEWAMARMEVRLERVATEIVVNPSEEKMFDDAIASSDLKLRVTTDPYIPPNYFWLIRQKGEENGEEDIC